MRAFGRRHITAVEGTDEIVFRVVRERGWLGPTIGIAVFAFALLWFMHTLSVGAAVVALVAIAVTAADWLQGNITALFVSKNGLKVRGNIGKLLNDEIFVGANNVASLGYEVGGKNEPSGFYARHKSGQICLLIGLSEQQSIDIATAIYMRFPDIGSGDTETESTFLGHRSETITLGLTQK